jgi:hypothetical protein
VNTSRPAAPVEDLAGLRRIRWAVRATLTVGVAASVAANVLHAQGNTVSQLIAAWPPCALLLTVELVSRVPVHRWWLGVVRVGATVVIAGIAGWVSYWHMAAVASRYGEADMAAFLLPFSVDGLIVVASICLVELAGRIRTTHTTVADADNHTDTSDRREAPTVVAATATAGPADTNGTGGTGPAAVRARPVIGEITR